MKNSQIEGPRWITPPKICRILHILPKPNSIIALLFLQNISSYFVLTTKTTEPRPEVFSVNRSITCNQAALLTSSVQYDKILFKFRQQQLVMVNYVCVFNQSETGKYFERIIRIIITKGYKE